MLAFIETPLILFLVIVAPVWIIGHYVTRWRSTRMLSAEDEKLLAELWRIAERVDDRLDNIEKILDAESTEWRKQP